MVGEILNNLNLWKSDKSLTKFYFYSAHELTLNLLLDVVNLTNWECIWQNIMDSLNNSALHILWRLQVPSFLKSGRTHSQKIFVLIKYNGVYQKIMQQY